MWASKGVHLDDCPRSCPSTLGLYRLLRARGPHPHLCSRGSRGGSLHRQVRGAGRGLADSEGRGAVGSLAQVAQRHDRPFGFVCTLCETRGSPTPNHAQNHFLIPCMFTPHACDGRAVSRRCDLDQASRASTTSPTCRWISTRCKAQLGMHALLNSVVTLVHLWLSMALVTFAPLVQSWPNLEGSRLTEHMLDNLLRSLSSSCARRRDDATREQSLAHGDKTRPVSPLRFLTTARRLTAACSADSPHGSLPLLRLLRRALGSG